MDIGGLVSYGVTDAPAGISSFYQCLLGAYYVPGTRAGF